MTDIETIRDTAESEAVEAVRRADMLSTLAGGISVATAEENDRAAVVGREVAALLDRLETRRKELTQPLRDATDAINAAFKPATGLLTDSKQHIAGVMTQFRLAEEARVEREIAEAEARAARAFEEGRVTDGEVELADMVAIPEVARPPAGTGRTGRWKGEVVDIMAVCRAILEGALPPEAVTPQSAVINGYARSVRAQGVVHGIRVSYEMGISLSGKR